jgi:hypothetical protein
MHFFYVHQEKKLKNMEIMKEKRAKAEESRKAQVEKIFADEG